jgi:hypothetical protein
MIKFTNSLTCSKMLKLFTWLSYQHFYIIDHSGELVNVIHGGVIMTCSSVRNSFTSFVS